AYNDLDRAMLRALDNTLDYVISKQQLIHHQSVLARNYLLLTYYQMKPKINKGQDLSKTQY
ncbi:MAG: hypothetical protein ACYCX4_18040, partial [Bacillota bacterium]